MCRTKTLVAILMDITEPRRQMERRMRVAEEAFKVPSGY